MRVFFTIGVRFAIQVLFVAGAGGHVDDRITRRHGSSMHIAIGFDDPTGFGRNEGNFWFGRIDRIRRGACGRDGRNRDDGSSII